MILHVVLFTPKPDLPAGDRVQLIDALREAQASIPVIRRFRVGTRAVTGRPYDALARDFPYIALFEFDSQADLETYLAHPAHDRLAMGFYQFSAAAEAYDFDVAEVPEGLEKL